MERLKIVKAVELTLKVIFYLISILVLIVTSGGIIHQLGIWDFLYKITSVCFVALVLALVGAWWISLKERLEGK
jgi:putative effector of murein hydrolase LrgA (UPF0299 family)